MPSLLTSVIMKRPVLQVALDLLDLSRALPIAREAVRGGADWIEAGTPLIKSEGMESVRRLRSAFPGHVIVADMKVADTGALEVEMAAKAGASVVCILGDADDAVIAEAVRTASVFGVRLMADLINVSDPVVRSRELEALGVHILNAHVGIDQQMIGKSSLGLLEAIRGAVAIEIAVAGGLDARTAPQASARGADIVIVGGAITRSADVQDSARKVREALDAPASGCGCAGLGTESPGSAGCPCQRIYPQGLGARGDPGPPLWGFSPEYLGCDAPERRDGRDHLSCREKKDGRNRSHRSVVCR